MEPPTKPEHQGEGGFWAGEQPGGWLPPNPKGTEAAGLGTLPDLALRTSASGCSSDLCEHPL